jgi:hypothetical protein
MLNMAGVNDVNRLLGVVLRVPSLFLLDELFRAAFGMAYYYYHWETDDSVGDERQSHSSKPSLVMSSTVNETAANSSTFGAGGATDFSDAFNATHVTEDATTFLTIVLPFTLSLLFHVLGE